MDSEFWCRVVVLEQLCSKSGVDCHLLRARIFSFVNDFPRCVAVGSLDGTACVYLASRYRETLLGALPVSLAHPYGCAVHSIVLAHVGSQLLVATGSADGSVRLFSTDGQLLGQFQAYESGRVYSLQLEESPVDHGLYVATATSFSHSEEETCFAHIWRIDSRVISLADVFSARRIASCHHRLGVNGLSLDVQRNLLATASDDHSAGLFGLDGTLVARCMSHTSFVWEVALAADKGLLATACDDGFVRVFDLSGVCLRSLDCGPGCCEVAIDSTAWVLLATCAVGYLRLWDLHDYTPLGMIDHSVETTAAALLLPYKKLLSVTHVGELFEWDVDMSTKPWRISSALRTRVSTGAAVTVAVR
eukprot:TRINITY_DN63205_c0_g1_i1.p1 TRINITY_DN63205_c0_g1~~TRINITY_DN63205_c0_g1_i1.p1  ORF type:complete len:378 (-),score=32.06 TRINITY_DN63205_c0_g1_i1:256-1338(-)